MKRSITLICTSMAALALAGCEGDTDGVAEPGEGDGFIVATDDDELYPAGGDLNEAQQRSYDAMDRQAVSDEYDANRRVIDAEARAGDGGVDSATSGTGAGSSDGSDDTDAGSSAASAGETAQPIPRRGAMTFDYLDRNDDGKLSVAEYAIWALPTNPNVPEPDDQLKPYLTADEINEAGRTFFFFDDDGDTYLSQGEFADARNSSRTR